MLEQRDDQVWEILCDACKTKLTEQVVGDLPRTAPAAMVRARMAGWRVTPDTQICFGCKDHVF